jgi:hypothetical protein
LYLLPNFIGYEIWEEIYTKGGLLPNFIGCPPFISPPKFEIWEERYMRYDVT